jgi:multidrug transporter EmrE-like cation transporter
MSFFDITGACIFETFGDFAFKDFARGGGAHSFVQGLFGYAGIIFFLIRSLRVGNVTYVNGLWSGLSVMFETLAALFIFKEKLNSLFQYAGLIMVIVGTLILHAGGIPYN